MTATPGLPPSPRPTPSAELFSIPVAPDRYLVYAPLRRAAFVTNARGVNLVADLRDGTAAPEGAEVEAMTELLRRLEIVDAGPETRPITTFEGEPTPTEVTLFLTTACNLRCTYCYAAAGDTPTRMMSLDTARRGIDFVLGNALALGAPSIDVSYHGGGEPTVAWSVMTESHAYARRVTTARGIALRSSAATNGVLSDEKLDWIVDHLDSVSLSFDGLPSAQDRHRPTAGGRGSAEAVMRTMRRFDAADFPYGVRMTVTADQIPQLPESVAFVCEQFGPDRIQVEPAYQIGRWEDAPSAETAGFIEAYREAQRRARALGRDIWFSGARLGTLTNHFCGVTQDSFCLSPDGNVSACYEVFSESNRYASRFFYGKPGDDGYAFDRARLDALRGQAVQDRAYCQGCFAKWSCGGDCYHKALTVEGEGEFAGTDRCHVIRELTKDQILDRIASAGGVVWHEPDPADPAERSAGKEMLV